MFIYKFWLFIHFSKLMQGNASPHFLFFIQISVRITSNCFVNVKLCNFSAITCKKTLFFLGIFLSTSMTIPTPFLTYGTHLWDICKVLFTIMIFSYIRIFYYLLKTTTTGRSYIHLHKCVLHEHHTLINNKGFVDKAYRMMP